MFVDVQRAQVWIEQQLIGLDIDGRLASALVAHVPLWIDETPEAGTWVTNIHNDNYT